MQGYYERKAADTNNFRNLAYVSYCLNTEKGKRVTIEKFWSIPLIDKNASSGRDVLVMTKDMLAKIKKAHNLK